MIEIIAVAAVAILILLVGVVTGIKIEEESLMERYHKYPERLEPDYQDWKAKKRKR